MAKQVEFKDEFFGPILHYIKDQKVTDINCSGPEVWVDHLEMGKFRSDVELTEEFVDAFCTRISNEVSENFNKFDNLLEAETEELRISVIHDSVTSTGTAISIRKTPAVRRLSINSILETEYCTDEVLDFLISCAKGHLNIVFCGLPGSGKTELLKFLSQFIPKYEKVITIEDNLEIHFKKINPENHCVETKVNDNFSYTKAIKAALRQNVTWILLSEARSVEVEFLLEALSTGLHGLTTLHTDDVRKVPDRIQNMIRTEGSMDRIENDIYSFIDVGILISKKVRPDGKIIRMVDQIALYDRANGVNTPHLLIDDGEIVNREIPENIMEKIKPHGITKLL